MCALIPQAVVTMKALSQPTPREGAPVRVSVAPRRSAVTTAISNESTSRASLSSTSMDESGEPVVEGVVNYRITLEIKEPGLEARVWKYVATDGDLEINSLMRETVKIDADQLPRVVTLNATLRTVSEDTCRVKLLVGRTVPFVTGVSGSAGAATTRSQIQQVQVGFSGTVLLDMGKPLVVQDDDSQRMTVTLERMN